MKVHQRFKRLSIATQAFWLLMLMLLGTVSALYFWAKDNAMASEVSHTRTVADMADAYRAQAARHGGFYIRREASEPVEQVGRFLAHFPVDATLADGSVRKLVFHQKNPFLALGDFCSEVQKSPAAAKCRMASDNYMNPANAPDLFELTALQKMREGNRSEYWGIVQGQLRYTRALIADKACLSCHGDPDKAPPFVQAQYRTPVGSKVGGGYGYQEGAVVGITSISIAHKTPMEMIRSQNAGFWMSASFVLALMALSYLAVRRGLVAPLRSQLRYTEAIAASEDLKAVPMPVLDEDEATSSNEIHQQSHALKALHDSMQSAVEYIQKTR
jgi:hypothetical protein